MRYKFVRAGNTKLGRDQELDVRHLLSEPSDISADQSYRRRVGRGPTLETRSYPERTIRVRAYRKDRLPSREVQEIFNLRGGEQEWEFVDLDTETSYVMQAACNRLRERSNTVDQYEAELVVREPAKALTATTATAGPLEVYGNTFALPTITFTPTTSTLNWRKLTATDNTGRGLANHPIKFEFDSTGVAADQPENVIVFYGPRPVPFYVSGAGTATTIIWLRMDLPADGSAHCTVFYGSDVNNTDTVNTYLPGGMDLTTSDNQTWKWNDWRIRQFPNANGAWQPGVFPPIHSFADISLDSTIGVELTSLNEATDEATAEITTDRANAIVLTTGVAAASSNALEDLARTVDGGASSKFQVRYQVAGQTHWQSGWHEAGGSEGPFEFTAPIDVPGAAAILATIQGGDAGTGTMFIGSGAAADATETPGAAANLEHGLVTGTAWSDVNNVLAPANEASVTLASGTNSRYLTATDFGFTIPVNAIITGIKAEVYVSRSGTGSGIRDHVIRLMDNGVPIGADRYTGALSWNAGWRTYGDTGDTWSWQWDAATINASNFGIAISANNVASTTRTGYIHELNITVYYIEAGAQPTLSLDTTETPTTTIGAANTGRLLDGAFTVTHPDSSTTSIMFDKLYMSDTNLTVDCDDMRMWVDADTWYTLGKGIAFTDKFRWVALPPGKHTVSDDLDASWSLSFRNRLDL